MAACHPSQSLRIRPAREDDVPVMRQIAIAAWKPIFDEYRRAAGEEFFALNHSNWRETKAAQVENHFRNHPEWTFVTEYNGRVVGFITFRINEQTKTAEIGNNAIHPDFQGRGLGLNQYRHVIRFLRERGMKFVVVATGLDKAHAPARAAYEKAGFKPLHRSIKYFMRL